MNEPTPTAAAPHDSMIGRADARAGRGAIGLVANYESDVGYAWWLMENFWALIARQAQASDRRSVLAYPRIGAIPGRIKDAPIDIFEFRIARGSLREVLAGARFFRSHDVRSVYLTDWPYLHWCYLFWRLAGVRRIVNHDHSPGVRPNVRGLRSVIKRALYSLRVFSCDQYVAVSHYIGQRLIDNARAPADRCTVVENGIAPFEPAASERAAVRARIGVPEDAFLIALVSRATYYKGLDFAVRAVAALHAQAEQGAPVYAVHCGDGPDVDAFRKLANELDLGSRFTFLGRRSDVREILASADVAFHPSKGEAMSLAILEFMCAGLPVVVPDNPSVCTSVMHEVTGVVYPAGDLDAARAALASLRNDDDRRRTLGSQARAVFLRKHLLDQTNEVFSSRVARLL